KLCVYGKTSPCSLRAAVGTPGGSNCSCRCQTCTTKQMMDFLHDYPKTSRRRHKREQHLEVAAVPSIGSHSRYRRQKPLPSSPPPQVQQFLLAVSGPGEVTRIVQDAAIRSVLARFSCELCVGGSLLRCRVDGQSAPVMYCCLRLAAQSAAVIQHCLRQLELLQPRFAGRIVVGEEGAVCDAMASRDDLNGLLDRRLQQLDEDPLARGPSSTMGTLKPKTPPAKATSSHRDQRQAEATAAVTIAPIASLPPSQDRISMYFSESERDEIEGEASTGSANAGAAAKSGGGAANCGVVDGRWWLHGGRTTASSNRNARLGLCSPHAASSGSAAAAAEQQSQTLSRSMAAQCGSGSTMTSGTRAPPLTAAPPPLSPPHPAPTPPPSSPPPTTPRPSQRSHSSRTLTECIQQMSLSSGRGQGRSGGGEGCESSIKRLRSLISDSGDAIASSRSSRCSRGGHGISTGASIGEITGTPAASTGASIGAITGTPAASTGQTRPTSSSTESTRTAIASPSALRDPTGALSAHSSSWWWQRARRRCLAHKRIVWFLPVRGQCRERRLRRLLLRLLACQPLPAASKAPQTPASPADLIDLSGDCENLIDI
ncbi:hypothetical protein BOX15_Mlig028595g1, partial [Macrostomum lignano]